MNRSLRNTLYLATAIASFIAAITIWPSRTIRAECQAQTLELTVDVPQRHGDSIEQRFSVPLVVVVVALALLVCGWIWSLLDHTPAGLCRSCGYDLRASGDRCPECGRPVKRNSH